MSYNKINRPNLFGSNNNNNDDYPTMNHNNSSQQQSPSGGYALQPAASSDGHQYANAANDQQQGPRTQRSLNGTGAYNPTNSSVKRTMLDSMDRYQQNQTHQRSSSRTANNSSGRFRIHRNGRTQTEGSDQDSNSSPQSESEGGTYNYRQRNNNHQGGSKSKSITIQSTTFKRKQNYVFTEKEFNNYLKTKALKGVQQVAPSPSSELIVDFHELQDQGTYKKVALGFIDKKLGLADAGYSGLKYTIDNLVPPFIHFLYDLNHTVQTGIMNDQTENASFIAARLLDGTVAKQLLNWNSTIDFILFVGGIYELHCSIAELRVNPMNPINLMILAISAGLMLYVIERRYNFGQVASKQNDPYHQYFIAESKKAQSLTIEHLNNPPLTQGQMEALQGSYDNQRAKQRQQRERQFSSQVEDRFGDVDN